MCIEIKISNITDLTEHQLKSLSNFFNALHSHTVKTETVFPSTKHEEFDTGVEMKISNPFMPNIPPPPKSNLSTAPQDLEVDATGAAWDARIHAKTKSKTSKGVWRTLKDADRGLVKKLKNNSKENIVDFPFVMKKIATLISTKKLSHMQVLDILNPLGISSLPLMAQYPKLLLQISDALDELVGG